MLSSVELFLLILANAFLMLVLFMQLMRDKDFWKRVITDGGEPSLSRVCTLLIVIFSCVWISAIVAHSFAFPDFGGLSLLVGTLYGLNVGLNAYKQAKIASVTGVPDDGKPSA
jgi:hypothetical protein